MNHYQGTRKGCPYEKPGRLTNEEPLDENMCRWFSDRGIPAETAKAEGIVKVCRRMPQTEQVEKCIVFPYTVEDELVNRKYRDGAKHFMLESGAELVPWRIDHIRDTPECIITEGEMDALSFLVARRDDVISVPNGAQKNLTYLDRFIETHLENKQRVYIASDTDAKGLELRNELVRRFGEEKCRIVTYGEGCKDANELLLSRGVDALKKAVAEAQEVPLEGIFTASDVKDELLSLFENGLQQGATLKMGILDYLLSLETGRLMIVTGYNRYSIGICYEGGLNERGLPADTRTPEQKDTLQKLLKRLEEDYPEARVVGHRDLPGVKKDCPCYVIQTPSSAEGPHPRG